MFRQLIPPDRVIAMGWIRSQLTGMNRLLPEKRQETTTTISTQPPPQTIQMSPGLNQKDLLSNTVPNKFALLNYLPLNFTEMTTLSQPNQYTEIDFQKCEDNSRDNLNTPEPFLLFSGSTTPEHSQVESSSAKHLPMIEEKLETEDSEVIKILQSAVQQVYEEPKLSDDQYAHNQMSEYSENYCDSNIATNNRNNENNKMLGDQNKIPLGVIKTDQEVSSVEPYTENSVLKSSLILKTKSSEQTIPIIQSTTWNHTEARDCVNKILDGILLDVVSKTPSTEENLKSLLPAGRKRRGRQSKSKVSEQESPKSKGSTEKNKRKNPNPRKVEKPLVNLENVGDSGEDEKVNPMDTPCNDEIKSNIVLSDNSWSRKTTHQGYGLRQTRPYNVKRTLCVAARKPQKNIVRHVCKLCGKQFTHGRPFKSHLQSHARADACCRQCKESFKNEALFLHHNCAKELENAPKHICLRCNHETTSARKLSLHMRLVHKISVTSVANKSCALCGEVFTRRSLLYEHMLAIHYPGQTMCMKCGKILANFEELKEHTNTVHQRRPCKQCTAVFFKKSSFQEHLMSHDSSICCVCGDDYEDKDVLQQVRTFFYKKF